MDVYKCYKPIPLNGLEGTGLDAWDGKKKKKHNLVKTL